MPAPGRAADLRRAGREGGRAGARADGRGAGEGRPAGAVVAQPGGVGADPVRHRQGRRDPGEREPGLPGVGAEVRAEPVGRADADLGPRAQDLGLRGDDRAGPRRRRRPGARGGAGRPGLGRAGGGGGRGGRGRAARAQRVAERRRPDQPPVHQRHHGLPQGRHAEPPQHPEQRLLRGRVLPLHRAGPGVHPGALLPLLRHGHGQPGLHHPRRLHGGPGRGVRARGHAARGGRREVHQPLRRPHDVHRRAGPARTSATTTCPACAPGSWPARRARSR